MIRSIENIVSFVQFFIIFQNIEIFNMEWNLILHSRKEVMDKLQPFGAHWRSCSSRLPCSASNARNPFTVCIRVNLFVVPVHTVKRLHRRLCIFHISKCYRQPSASPGSQVYRHARLHLHLSFQSLLQLEEYWH
jgi:hypothetical protein